MQMTCLMRSKLSRVASAMTASKDCNLQGNKLNNKPRKSLLLSLAFLLHEGGAPWK
jgi:hypothetical protein